MIELEAIEEPYPLTDDFRLDWADLYGRAPGANVFTTLEWLERGWECFAESSETPLPFRFVTQQGETAAMCLHKRTVARRAWGRATCWRTLDYNSQRIAPVLANDIPSLASALACLHRRFGSRTYSFDFFKLDGLNGGLAQATQSLRRAGLRPQLRVFNEQPRIIMPDAWEEYRKSRSKTFWKSPRRWKNRMGREVGEVRYERLGDPCDLADGRLDAAMEKVFDLFRRSWQHKAIQADRNMSAANMEAFYRAVAKDMAAKGMLDLNLLYAGNKLLAMDMNLCEGKTVYMVFGVYDAEFAKYSPGTILMIESLQHAHSRGKRIFEFGGEHLEYKEKWTKDKANAYHLRLRGRTLAARLRSAVERG